MSQEIALPLGADADELTRFLASAHDEFVTTGTTDPAMRRVVADSWRRSVASGVDPEVSVARIRLADDVLAGIRAAHPLTSVMPVIRRLLVDSATDAGLLVAVSDAAGQLLYVEGASDLRSRAESMHFLPGADWSEASVGTNAPGTALALDRPVQILGAEHLSRQVTPWSCSAAPIHDPDTGAMLGVLDVTGGPQVATPQALSLVRATAAAAEAELRIARMTAATSFSLVLPAWAPPRIDVLGRSGAVLTVGATTSRLSQRHSEMLLLLSRSSEGLSTAELGVALSDEEQPAVTIRAEISRMRTLVGGLRLASRPYRLESAIRSDLDEVRGSLRSGEVRRAVSAYVGPVLPSSSAPGVVEIRDDLHLEVRATVLASGDVDAMLGFADTPHGRADHAVWERVLTLLPQASPRRPQVAAHVARLDAELG